MYYNRLINESQYGSQMDDLLNAWNDNQTADNDTINTNVVEPYKLRQDLIIVWYNATIQGANDQTGMYDPHAGPFQYQMALAWQASNAHPQGWAPENAPFYWRLPAGEDSYNGLGPFSH